MGKSPAKWIKTALFGKKSSKSNLSKDVTLDKKSSISTNSQAEDFGADFMVVSPVPSVIDVSEEHTQLEKRSSANLTDDTSQNVRSTMRLNTTNDDELTRLEQAATKAQAAFRGYLARRAFWALKGIIRLQALVRGHLVRRQAVATLSCMRAIVKFQALVRGRKVRLCGNGRQMLQKKASGELVTVRVDLLQTSLKSEKLSTNAFGSKLVASSNTIMPLSIQYDPIGPNSVRKWLERWSSSHFWDPLPRPKQPLDLNPRKKQTKLQSGETDTVRPKRSVRRIPPPNLDSNPLSSSQNEKPKRTARKTSTLQSESELDKVNHSPRKISVPSSEASGKSEVTTEKLLESSDKVSTSLTPTELEQVNDIKTIAAKQLEPEPLSPLVEPPLVETNGEITNELSSNVGSNGKENQKTRRRKSLTVKQEYSESESPNTPTVPSYMAATESAKAKLRAQAAAKSAENGGENGFDRRHSLPSGIGKVSLQSPRVQKPLQVNGKGGSKTNKLQIFPRDEKVASGGWRR